MVTTYFCADENKIYISLDGNMERLAYIDKRHEEVSTDFDFTAYYVSIVPGQNLMRSQVWDISWKLGNTAGNGGVVSGGTFVFRPHLS